MILAPVTAQLATIPRVAVDDTTALAEIATAPLNRPLVIYVIPDAETGRELGENFGVWLDQYVDVGFACVVAVKPSAVRGGQAADLETIKEAVKAKLMGWRAPDAERPTVYLGAALLRLDAEVMAMMLRFSVRFRTRVMEGSTNG